MKDAKKIYKRLFDIHPYERMSYDEIVAMCMLLLVMTTRTVLRDRALGYDGQCPCSQGKVASCIYFLNGKNHNHQEASVQDQRR